MGSRWVCIAAAIVALMLGGSVAGAAEINDGAPPIFVGGRAVHEPAIVKGGVVLVPVRGIFEVVNARVSYTPPRIVVVRKNGTVVAGLVVGSRHAVVDNRPHMLAVAPVRRGRRVYVPLRVVAELVGATVTYASRPRLIDIHVGSMVLADEPPPLPPAAPPDDLPPVWLMCLVGLLVVAFFIECFRRLTMVLAAKRSRVSR